MNKRGRKPKQEQQDERPIYDDDLDLREFLNRMHNAEQFRQDFERSADDE